MNEDRMKGLAAELVRAGRAEVASPSARARANALSSGLASASLGSSWWMTAAKWLSLTLAFFGAGELARRSLASDPVVARMPSPARLVAEPPVLASTVAAPSPSSALAAIAKPAARTTSTVPSAPPPAPVRSAASDGARDHRLREELDVLHAARAAIARSAGREALATLAAQKDGFRFLPIEAALVRIEALSASGDAVAARALAAQLLPEHGAGPYGRVLRDWASGHHSR